MSIYNLAVSVKQNVILQLAREQLGRKLTDQEAILIVNWVEVSLQNQLKSTVVKSCGILRGVAKTGRI